MELTIWEKALDDAIRSAEKLVQKLKALKNLPGAEEKLAGSVSAAKLSEGVTLHVRSLPGHTGHPMAREHLRSAIREAVPVELGFTEQGWFCLRMPMLLPRKEKSSRSYLRGFLYPALEEFTANLEPIRLPNCVMIFRHVYDHRRPEREYRDHDNIELNTVVDAIAMFFLVDDTPLECRHYYCSASGEKEMTEVYIVPREEFESWLAMEKNPEKLRKKLYENLPETAGK